MAKQQRSKRNAYNISNENFIKAWQSSSTFDEVLKTLGVPRRYASSRATFLRRKKVTLKHFKRPAAAFDVKALNALAKKYLKG